MSKGCGVFAAALKSSVKSFGPYRRKERAALRACLSRFPQPLPAHIGLQPRMPTGAGGSCIRSHFAHSVFFFLIFLSCLFIASWASSSQTVLSGPRVPYIVFSNE